MPDKYFDKFPTINYNNNNVVDITKRVALLERVSSNPFAFYPYEISSNERADQLSYRYYEDPFKSWILYLGNKIVDPYYEWYLHTEEFEEYIVNKYGSYENAVEKIKFYRNNWAGVEDINVNYWNSLPKTLQNYWEPKFGFNNKIIAYKRKQVDWKINTNKIVQYSLPTVSPVTAPGKSYVIDEVVNIVFDNYNSGRGQVLSASNSEVFIQHLSGTYVNSANVGITTNSYIYGTESLANNKFYALSVLSSNLSEEEFSYWTPVTCLDYENEKNEFNKSVRVIDSNLKQTMVNNLKDLMSE